MERKGSFASLVVSEEGKPERTLPIGDRLTIGRSPGNDLVVDDQAASRRHAEIRHEGGGRYSVADIASANGTWLNARRLGSPRELADGDVISIGRIRLRFCAAAVDPSVDPAPPVPLPGTDLSFRSETVVILVADIRDYTGMSESIPGGTLSILIADWFREAGDIIERRGGIVDKFIGDAVMAYWEVRERSAPGPEVDGALEAARDLLGRSEAFDQRVRGEFPGRTFRIGIGVNLGDAVAGNVGGGGHRSFTIVGDSVNVAFRLESLTKEKRCAVVVSPGVTEHASSGFEFFDLGQAEVRGRTDPVSIWGLKT